jgi:hypothetical protein
MVLITLSSDKKSSESFEFNYLLNINNENVMW